MANIGNEIAKITEQTGRPANVVTSSLKSLGNGKMENGLKVIAEHAEKIGYVKGVKQGYLQGSKSGAIKGSALTTFALSCLGGIVYLYKKNKYKKEIKELENNNAKDKKQIINAFEDASSTSNDTSQDDE